MFKSIKIKVNIFNLTINRFNHYHIKIITLVPFLYPINYICPLNSSFKGVYY